MDLDKIMNEYEEDEKQAEIKDQLILKQVSEKVSGGAYQEILEELKECEYTYAYEITDTPKGELRNFDEYEHIEGVYVNQTMNGGYTGDSYGGTCAIKIAENEYFQFSYSM